MSKQAKCSPPGPFNQALSRFQVSLSSSEIEDFEFTTLQDVENVIADIQEKQATSKTIKNVNRIKPFLEAMEQYGKVIEVFLNVSMGVAFVWGPVKFLLLAASNVIQVFDTILDAYERLGENMPLLSQYESLFHQPLMRKVLVLIFEDILEFHREALKMLKRRAWSVVFAALWKDFGKRFQKILDNLERHSHLLECQATLTEFEAAQAARRQAENDFNEIQKAQRDQQLISVTRWLASVEVNADQEKFTAVRRPYPGSCRWIFRHSTVKKWINSPLRKDTGLWLYGILGAGKTILASAVVEELQNEPDASICFFFCKHGTPAKTTFHSLARTFLVQILRQNKGLLPYIYERQVASCENTLVSSKILEELLDVAIQVTGKAFIIVDGLDECEKSERAKVLAWLKSITEAAPTGNDIELKVMVSSTDENDIKRKLSKFLKKKIEPGDVQEDVKSYLNSRAVELQDRFQLSDYVSQAITREILKRANGMFLYAYLTMENLISQPTKVSFEHELKPDVFPAGLGQAYDRIVNRIYKNPIRAKHAAYVLGWVVCAKRPLRWNEIQGAISIDLETRAVDFNGRRLRDDVKDLCGSLVEIQDGVLELVHTTAKIHLIEQQIINTSEQEMKLAGLCTRYLGFEYFNIDSSDRTIASHITSGCYSFLDYAAVHWISHVEACCDRPDLYDKSDIDSLGSYVAAMLAQRWKDSQAKPVVSEATKRRFQAFSQSEAVERLAQLAPSRELGLSENGFLDLGAFIPRMRAILEKTLLLGDQRVRSLLIGFYGERPFKCNLPYCIHFYNGFSSSKLRDQHLQQHERPFRCTHTGCPIADIGCATKRQLNAHLLKTHPLQATGVRFPSPMEYTNAQSNFLPKVESSTETDGNPKATLAESHGPWYALHPNVVGIGDLPEPNPTPPPPFPEPQSFSDFSLSPMKPPAFEPISREIDNFWSSHLEYTFGSAVGGEGAPKARSADYNPYSYLEYTFGSAVGGEGAPKARSADDNSYPFPLLAEDGQYQYTFGSAVGGEGAPKARSADDNPYSFPLLAEDGQDGETVEKLLQQPLYPHLYGDCESTQPGGGDYLPVASYLSRWLNEGSPVANIGIPMNQNLTELITPQGMFEADNFHELEAADGEYPWPDRYHVVDPDIVELFGDATQRTASSPYLMHSPTVGEEHDEGGAVQTPSPMNVQTT